MTDLLERVRREEEARRNAARFRDWSRKFWFLKARDEVAGALRTERENARARLELALDDLEASSARVGLLAVAAFIVSMERGR